MDARPPKPAQLIPAWLAPRVTPALALLAAVGASLGLSAAESRTSFGVQTTVSSVAHLELQSVPAQVLLSAEDLQRGYVDVPEPTRLAVRSNSPNGFQLDVRIVSPMLTAMAVHGLDGEQALGADGGTIVQRWTAPQPVSLALTFRFLLVPGLEPGRYPWPVRVAVRPL